MIVRLEVVEGPEAGRAFEFKHADSFLVGRSPKAHFVLEPESDPLISRHHFLLDVRPPRCLLQDLESKNGTFVNGRRIAHSQLADRDEIRVGRTVIRVRLIGLEEMNESAPVIEESPSVAATTPLPSPPPAGAAASGEAGPEISFGCMGCGRDLERWAQRDGWAEILSDARYLCPTCAAGERSPNVQRERIGHYRVLRELGRGGMGVVYKAVNEDTRRLCAVKEILPDDAQVDRSVRLFDREIGVQSMVTHPNLARILERGRDGSRLYFAVEYLEGGDVHRLVAESFRGPVPPSLACRVISDILSGLQALHDHGFVHRDLKPRNLLLDRPYVDPSMRAKITDYGLAKSFEEAGNSLFDLTRVGEVAGSMMFMAPEQILEYRFVKPPADVYSVGVSLYFLLTRRFSVDFPQGPGRAAGRHPIHVMIEDPPIPIRDRMPSLPEDLAAVVDRAVTKTVDDRFQTAESFRLALEAVIAREGWR